MEAIKDHQVLQLGGARTSRVEVATTTVLAHYIVESATECMKVHNFVGGGGGYEDRRGGGNYG